MDMEQAVGSGNGARSSGLAVLLLGAALALLLGGCTDSGVRIYKEPPKIDSFTATRTPISAGTKSALIATFTGLSARVEPGVGEVQSGQLVEVSPAESTRYLLTVTGENGDELTAEATVEVVAPPGAPAIQLPTHVTANRPGYEATATEVAGCRYAWSIEGGALDSAADGMQVRFTPGASGVVRLNVSVIDGLEASASATATAAIVAAPVAPIIPLPSYVESGKSYLASVEQAVEGSSYRWVLSGASPESGAGAALSFTVTGAPGEVLTVRGFETNRAGTEGAEGIATSTIIAQQSLPIVALPEFVTQGIEALASVSNPASSSLYRWAITGGVLEKDEGVEARFTPTAQIGERVSLSVVETNVAGSEGQAGSASSLVVAPPTKPLLDAPALTTQGGVYNASVIGPVEGSSYEWTIVGGQLDQTSGATVTFAVTGAPGGALELTCVEINRAGARGPAGSASIGIAAAPGAPTLSAPSLVTAGEDNTASVVGPDLNATYSWSIVGGQIVAEQGSSVTFRSSGAAGSPVLLFCAATNLAGTTSSPGASTSTVVEPPKRPLITVPQHVTREGYVSATVQNLVGTSSYTWTVFGAEANALTGPTITFRATGPVGGTVTLSCIETNSAASVGEVGTAASIIVDGTLAPIIDVPQFVTEGLVASAEIANANHSSSYTWTIQGGTFEGAATGTRIEFRPTELAGGVVSLGCVETNQAQVQGLQGTALSLVVEPPAVPVIEAPSFTVAEGNYSLTVANLVAASRYRWTILGATPERAEGASVTIMPTAPAGVQISVRCVEINQAGTEGDEGSKQIPIVGASKIPLLDLPQYVTRGEVVTVAVQAPVPTSTYHWSISGGLLHESEGRSVTFTPDLPAGSQVELSCIERSMAGEDGEPGYASGMVVPPPSAPMVVAPEYISTTRAFSAAVQNPVGTSKYASTYTWTVEGAIPAKAWGPSFTFTASGAHQSQVLLSCTETNRAGSTGPATQVTATIIALPAVPVVEVPSLVTAGRSASASVAEPVEGSSYTWAIEGGSLITTVGTEVTFTPSGVAGGVVTLYCVEKNRAGTEGGRGKAQSTIVAEPGMPTLSQRLYATQGELYSANILNAKGESSYRWTIEGGLFETEPPGAEAEGAAVQYRATGLPGGLVTLECTEINRAGAAGSPRVSTSTILELPSAPVVLGPGSVLPGKKYSVSIEEARPAEFVYGWSLSGAIPATGAGAALDFWPTGAVESELRIAVVATNLAGTTGPEGVKLVQIVGEVGVPELEAPEYVTAGEQFVARVRQPAAATAYEWSISGGDLATSTGESVLVTPRASGMVLLLCVAVTEVGTSAPGSKVAEIVAPPVVPVLEGLPSKVTAGMEYWVKVQSPVSGSKYAWEVTGAKVDDTRTVGSVLVVEPEASGAVSIFCTETNRAGSVGTPASVSGAIFAKASVPSVSAPQIVAADAKGILASISPQSNAAYLWSIKGGKIDSSDNGASVQFTAASSGEIQLDCTVTNGAGDSSATGTATIQIIEPPKTDIAAQLVLTMGENGVASVPAQYGATYLWSVENAQVLGATDDGYRVVYKPSSVGRVLLKCAVTNALGVQGSGSNEVTIWPASRPSVLGEPVASVAAGGYHTCVVTAAGGVKCWGSTNNGGLGTGTTAASGYPLKVATMESGVTAVAAAGLHTCAIQDGRVWCWGLNSNAQLGDSSAVDRSSPVRAGSLSGMRHLVAGHFHNCALDNAGKVWCWGLNASGQLGQGVTDTLRAYPVQVSQLGSGVSALAAGYHYSCALKNGEIWCWGRNSSGQLGNGTLVDSNLPVAVAGLGGKAVAIAGGGTHACALFEDGSVKCWGANDAWQLGSGGTGANSLTPVVVKVNGATTNLTGVVALAGGGMHTCALTRRGEVFCWGKGAEGELGNGSVANQRWAVAVSGMGVGSDVVALSATYFHTCALRSSGGLHCWGKNESKQLGTDTTVDSAVPVPVLGFAEQVTAVEPGQYHICALFGGAVSCWGDNQYGQLGNGSFIDSVMPSGVVTVPGGVSALSVGELHNCVLSKGGLPYCWGWGARGQLGDGYMQNRAAPVQVTGVTTAQKIAASALHSCAVANGAAKCWGTELVGQLGNGGGLESVSSNPVSVVGLTSGVSMLASKGSQGCALKGGAMSCWGYNYYGQLGNNSQTNSDVPVAVAGLGAGVKDIVVGNSHVCAIGSTGGVKCWGRNGWGQLGDRSNTDRWTPVDVSGLSGGVDAVTAGSIHTCALKSGIVRCWGDGVGNRSYGKEPVAIAVPGSGVSAIASGGDHDCALTGAGALYCWGRNTDGEIGDNSSTARDTPVPVRLGQSMVLSVPDSLGRGKSAELVGVASSALPVAFESLSTGVCTISGGMVTVAASAAVGSACVVRATQNGQAPLASGGSIAPAPSQVRAILVTAQ